MDQGSIHSALPKCSSATCKDPAQPVLGAITSHEVSVLQVSLFKPWGCMEPESCGVCSVIRANLSPGGTALVLKAPNCVTKTCLIRSELVTQGLKSPQLSLSPSLPFSHLHPQPLLTTGGIGEQDIEEGQVGHLGGVGTSRVRRLKDSHFSVFHPMGQPGQFAVTNKWIPT